MQNELQEQNTIALERMKHKSSSVFWEYFGRVMLALNLIFMPKWPLFIDKKFRRSTNFEKSLVLFSWSSQLLLWSSRILGSRSVTKCQQEKIKVVD